MCIDWSIKATDVAIVFATIFGPIFAVWASEWRQSHRALQERKEKVFHTLMSTRAARLRIEHVGALNQIEYAFPRKSCAAIQDAWGLYLLHLRAPESASQDLAIRTAWNLKATDLLSEILYLMAVDLKLPYSRSEIKDNSYYPDAYVSDEIDLIETKKFLLQVLKDGRPINIRSIIDTPP